MTNKPDVAVLYDYLFHYNPYKKVWSAFTRSQYTDYFSKNDKSMMTNPDLDDLVADILIKHQENDKD